MEIQAISNSGATPIQSQSINDSASVSKTGQAGAQKTGKTPPPTGQGGAKPAATSESSSSNSSSSTAKIYDKRDTNKDGVVSYQEELLYSLKNSTDETQDQSAVSSSQKQTGLNAYQQNQPDNNLSKSFTSI